MKRLEKYEKDLDSMARLLRKRPMTAKQIAKELGLSGVSVRARIEALANRGWKLDTRKVRASLRGPFADQFRVVGLEKPKV